MEVPQRLSDLWLAADRIGAERGVDPRYVLDDCGLLLERPLRRWEYFCTPLNSLTFASTGGDGVHYGLLTLPQRPLETSPIVMTVPMAGVNNIVVAETFDEFFGLGYFGGWFSLEQLSYRPEWAVRFFRKPHHDWPEREALLTRLRTTLSFRHVPLRQRRIKQLQSLYLPLVRVPVDPPEAPAQPVGA